MNVFPLIAEVWRHVLTGKLKWLLQPTNVLYESVGIFEKKGPCKWYDLHDRMCHCQGLDYISATQKMLCLEEKPITWTGRVLPRFLLSAWSSWVNKYLWKQQVISSIPSNLCNYYCSSCTVVENIHKQYSHCVNNFMVYFVNLRGANHWNTCSSTQAVSTAGKLQPTDLTQYQCQPLLLRST